MLDIVALWIVEGSCALLEIVAFVGGGEGLVYDDTWLHSVILPN